MSNSNETQKEIITQLNPDDPTNLIISSDAAKPDEIKSSFKELFKQIESRAKLVRDADHLKELAKSWVTHHTKYGTSVYDDERYFARIKSDTRHTTFLRDVEISLQDVELMKTSFDKLNKDVPIYKAYVKVGTGSEQVWAEMYFTPEGVKLAQVAEIMMEISFEAPKEELALHYFAMPEYQDVLDSDKPLELVFVPNPDEAWVFVGGTTYPGDIYKPFCKYMNARVFAHGGAEIHGAGVVFCYDDPKSGDRVQKLLVISGLSLHGKTTLGVAEISTQAKTWFASQMDTTPKKLNLSIQLLHDDYIFVKPLKNSKFEVGVYAPNGIFPAMINDDPDNKVTSREDALLFNSVIKGNLPDFTQKFEFKDKRSGKITKVQNPRAAAPLKGSFEVGIWEDGVITEFDDFYYITLTRDPAAPSAIKWEKFDDAIKYAAGLVVAPTDAVVDRADDFYLNYMCTDFDVAPRGPFLKRMKALFDNMQDKGINVSCYTINTGAPEKMESLSVRDTILLSGGQWVHNKKLGFYYMKESILYSDLYIPWEENSKKDWVAVWKEMQERRKEFFAEKNLDMDKAHLDQSDALV
jgi:hypothetical protein